MKQDDALGTDLLGIEKSLKKKSGFWYILMIKRHLEK